MSHIEGTFSISFSRLQCCRLQLTAHISNIHQRFVVSLDDCFTSRKTVHVMQCSLCVCNTVCANVLYAFGRLESLALEVYLNELPVKFYSLAEKHQTKLRKDLYIGLSRAT